MNRRLGDVTVLLLAACVGCSCSSRPYAAIESGKMTSWDLSQTFSRDAILLPDGVVPRAAGDEEIISLSPRHLRVILPDQIMVSGDEFSEVECEFSGKVIRTITLVGPPTTGKLAYEQCLGCVKSFKFRDGESQLQDWFAKFKSSPSPVNFNHNKNETNPSVSLSICGTYDDPRRWYVMVRLFFMNFR